MLVRIREPGFGETFNLGLRNPREKFSREEISSLEKEGKYLWHLMCGTTSPLTDQADVHFVKVFREKSEAPNNQREYLWERYLAAREDEKRKKREELEIFHETPEYTNHIRSMYLSGSGSGSRLRSDQTDEAHIEQSHSRKCPTCRGSGMKGNGDNCDRCGGRAWIVTN
jgi:uncharacterized protein YifE (UPF0438 family)